MVRERKLPNLETLDGEAMTTTEVATDKRCTKCKQIRPIEEFCKHSITKDGLSHWCVGCRKKVITKHKREHPDKIKAAQDRYRLKNREKKNAWVRQWGRENPDKERAKGLVWEALERGDIIRPTHCEDCGKEEKLHGHHDDYSKPLDILWLCRSCHWFADKARREKEQGVCNV